MRETPACIFQSPLTDDALSLVLDGQADADTRQHLAACPGCQARLAAMQDFEAFLMTRLTRFECPTAQRLADYQAGLLVDEDARRVREHVARCPLCEDELRVLKSFIDDDEMLSEAVPAPNVIRPSSRIWRANQVEISGNLRKVRGPDSTAPRDARTNSATIFVEVETLSTGMVLKGQVIDEVVDWNGAVAELWQGGALQQVQALDEECEFRFDLTGRESLDLYITSTEGIALVLENLTLIS